MYASTKVVQTVPVGCISRSHGQKVGFQNAIFKKSPRPGSQFYIELCKKNLQTTSSFELLMRI